MSHDWCAFLTCLYEFEIFFFFINLFFFMCITLIEPFNATFFRHSHLLCKIGWLFILQSDSCARGSVCLIRKERSVPVKVQRMCQIPTGRPLTPSNIWPLQLCNRHYNKCPSQERGHVNLLDYWRDVALHTCYCGLMFCL